MAKELLNTLRDRRRTGARLIGVGVSHFTTGEEGTQLVLFDAADTAPALETDRDRRLSKAADELRERFGDDAIRPGRLL